MDTVNRGLDLEKELTCSVCLHFDYLFRAAGAGPRSRAANKPVKMRLASHSSLYYTISYCYARMNSADSVPRARSVLKSSFSL